MVNLDSLLSLITVSEENINLFSVRQSSRARRLIFKSSVRKGFEIVLPHVYDERWVRETVSRNKIEIEKRIYEIKDARKELRPTSVTLPVLGRSWRISYVEVYDKDINCLSEESNTLVIKENSEDVFLVPGVLQKWLHEKAFDYLRIRLNSMSARFKLPYNNLRIKRQRSLWGSCSAKRNINLNRNLMFMPYEVVDYVISHELAHLKVLNHSPKFWEELSIISPNYKNNRKQLKYFETFNIPGWALV